MSNSDAETQPPDDDMDLSYIDRLVQEEGSDDDCDDFVLSEENEDRDEDILVDEEFVTEVEAPVESFEEVLLWRQDGNFFDFIIKLNGGNYNVHKFALASGPNKSGFFEALIAEGHSEKVVQAPEDIAKSFPFFLDYMYSPPAERHHIINRDNWRSLYYFSDRFAVPKLNNDIVSFVEQDMHDPGQLEEYLALCSSTSAPEHGSSANPMHSPTTRTMFLRPTPFPFLLESATKVCAEMLLSIEVDSKLLASIPPVMFFQIIDRLKGGVAGGQCLQNLPVDKHMDICHLFVNYVKMHQANLSEFYFDSLTDMIYHKDDVKSRGLLAIEVLHFRKTNGWEGSSEFPEDIHKLAKYFTTIWPSQEELRKITSKLSPAARWALLANARGGSSHAARDLNLCLDQAFIPTKAPESLKK